VTSGSSIKACDIVQEIEETGVWGRLGDGGHSRARRNRSDWVYWPVSLSV